MKVKMLETYQGRDVQAVHAIDQMTVSILESGEEYEVSAVLGQWLVENRKAEVIETPHYGAQAEPQPRHDEEIHIFNVKSRNRRRGGAE